MSAPRRSDDRDVPPPLTPDETKLLARVRTLMAACALATLLGIAVILIVIGYRVLRNENRP